MEQFEQLVQHLRKFPGVGTRQARRFAYFLVRSNRGYTEELISLLKNNKEHMKLCPVSFQYFYSKKPEEKTSPIVRDPNRDKTSLMIVAKDMDIETIEQSHVYKGQYFVLGGLIPIVSSKYPVKTRTEELKNHLEKNKDTIQEVIFGFSFTPDGEHTREHIKSLIESKSKNHGFKLSTLGRGMSTGTELEYIDGDTFLNAFSNRK